MMKVAVICAVLVACVAAQPQRVVRSLGSELPEDAVRTVVKQLASAINSQEYSFSYSLGDGTKREETATLQNAGTPQEELVVEGLSQKLLKEGLALQTKYTLDKEGLRSHASLYDIGAGLAAALVGGGR